MSNGMLIRLGALAAILAGVLRSAASFIPQTTSGISALYFSIDVFLLIGIIGLYVFRRRRSRLGVLGLLLMLAALAILIARDLGMAPINAYAPGALIFSFGLDLFAIDSLRTRRFSQWIPILLILSTIIGPIGYFAPALRFLFALSGLTFGIAFTAAGVEMWLAVRSISVE